MKQDDREAQREINRIKLETQRKKDEMTLELQRVQALAQGRKY